MLKTTTETGDIGIFSIGPNVPSPVALQYPRRPTSRVREPRDHDTRHERHRVRDAYHDDRKRLPSYRDTTSEIISLYASETQRSSSRSFTPSIDQSGRSYSLTTCSSQAVPSSKSYATFRTYSSESGTNHPRSPYPYPARLKRPEVRSSSPSLTDDGSLDYGHPRASAHSSQHTMSRHHGPNYYPSSRRHPLGLSRREDHYASHSLPSRTSPFPGYGMPLQQRSRTPNSVAAWTSGAYGRPRQGSVEPSIRTESLTSIVEMYQGHHAPEQMKSIRSMGSFYYDYTEGFEQQTPKPIAVSETICPVPQRADSTVRPLLLYHESGPSLDTSPDLIMSDSSERHSDESEKGRSSECRPSVDIAPEEDMADCLPVETSPQRKDDQGSGNAAATGIITHLAALAAGKPRADGPMDEVLHNPPQSVNEAPTAPGILKAASPSPAKGSTPVETPMPDEPTSPTPIKPQYAAKTWAGDTETARSALCERLSSTSLKVPYHGIEPALTELASMLASFDYLARDPFSRIEDDTNMSSVVEVVKKAQRSSLMKKKYTGSDSGRGSLASKKKSFRKRHRRNAATLKMSVVAKPILKPKLSLPHLMKPLPPLPDEAFSARPGLGKAFMAESSRSGVPKLRLRTKARRSNVATGSSQREVSVDDDEGPTVPPKSGAPSPRPKLRLKLSRADFGFGCADKSATMLRTPALKQCNALAEFQHGAVKDLFTVQTPLIDIFTPPSDVANQDVSRTGSEEKQILETGPSPQPSDPFDIPYPPTPDVRAAESHGRPGTGRSANVKGSLVCRTDGKEPRRLRQKISMLRLRITGSHLAKHGKSLEAKPLFELKHASTPSLQMNEIEFRTTKASTANDDEAKHTAAHNGRVKRWANSAKEAVRWYVKRTLDRHSHETHGSLA